MIPNDKREAIDYILNYIPYFEELKEDEISRVVTEELEEDGTMPVQQLMYARPIIAFIEDVYVANILRQDYMEIMNLEAMGEIELEVLVYGLEQASYELTMAVLTCIVVQEKYAPGMWQIAAKEGWFLKVLYRLRDMMEDKSFS